MSEIERAVIQLSPHAHNAAIEAAAKVMEEQWEQGWADYLRSELLAKHTTTRED